MGWGNPTYTGVQGADHSVYDTLIRSTLVSCTHIVPSCTPTRHHVAIRIRPAVDRRGPTGHMQLVLLDHGLYRELSDAFRIE